ncbi:hypothetical protein EC844_101181 [Acinetobacter calcoaceticus]|uniref:Uncharacterized protein n=1 Tax=Acinetobacter calcoaceticus TaxID=471 RepID=A0A4R1Y1A8_ACICA|nr:hypothetical protein EC844_101181 [Acinetobacter calcoaceticus]
MSNYLKINGIWVVVLIILCLFQQAKAAKYPLLGDGLSEFQDKHDAKLIKSTLSDDSINSNCDSFLEDRLALFLSCQAWLISELNIEDAIAASDFFISNSIEITKGSLADDQALLRKFELNRKVFIVHPNGVTSVFNRDEYHEKTKLKSYICRKPICSQYFLWSYMLEMGEVMNPIFKHDAFEFQQQLLQAYEKKLNWSYRDDRIGLAIEGAACHIIQQDKSLKCFYYLSDKDLYIYGKQDDVDYLSMFLKKVKLK